MALQLKAVTVATAGTDGTSVGSATLGIVGLKRLVGIAVNYSSGQPVTTVVRVDAVALETKIVVTYPAGATDIPMGAITEALSDDVNVAVANTESPNLGLPLVAGHLLVDVTLADDAESVIVTFALED